MVLPPLIFLPFWLFFKAFCIAEKSNPWCFKNVPSSLAITAFCRFFEIFSIGTQSWLQYISFPANLFSTALETIKGVKGTGTNLKIITKNSDIPTNQTSILNKIRVIFLNINLFFKLNLPIHFQLNFQWQLPFHPIERRSKHSRKVLQLSDFWWFPSP